MSRKVACVEVAGFFKLYLIKSTAEIKASMVPSFHENKSTVVQLIYMFEKTGHSYGDNLFEDFQYDR